eukprot:s1_g991.t1
MADVLAVATSNLVSPAILAFLLGGLAGFLRSDLEIPEAIAKGLSIYLMLAIGLKGGASLAASDAGMSILPGLIAAVLLSFLIPYVAFFLLRMTTRFTRIDAAAVSAHYGSVSIVTFVTATQFLTSLDITYEAYIIAMVALMETPAIVSGLLLARKKNGEGSSKTPLFQPEMLREILFNGSIVLLLGGFVIGWATGEQGLETVAPFFVDPFQGVLCLFLLDMGLVAAHRLRTASSLSPSAIAFGLYMPLIGAVLGGATGYAVGLSAGGATLLAVLAASASYIAVPAAIRLALPKADPGIFIPLSLGVTFPFNVLAIMQMFKKKKIEVVVEAIYAPRVVEAAKNAGAKGYTALPNLQGSGTHGDRRGSGLSGAFENVMVICIVDASIAGAVMAAIKEAIGDAIGVLYASDVEVLRDEHF